MEDNISRIEFNNHTHNNLNSFKINQRDLMNIIGIPQSSLPIINTDVAIHFIITGLTTDITSMTTHLSGNPIDGQKLIISIIGTATRNITWGTKFESSTVTLPTATSGTNRLDIGFIFNKATSCWRCVCVS